MDLGNLTKLQNKRKCIECGEEFKTDGEMTAMQKHADHLMTHGSTPDQWAMAHHRIQAAKEEHAPCKCPKCKEAGLA